MKIVPFWLFFLAGCVAVSPGKPIADASMPLPAVHASRTVTVEPEGDLDLPTALALTLERHPQLQGEKDLERLRAARIKAARVAPNPRLEFTAEDFLGSGAYRGVGGSSWTLSISQLIELGGKPQARAALAQAQHEVDAAALQLARQAVLSSVTLDFTRLVYLQERRANQAAQLENATGIERAIAARVEAGKDSAIQLRQYQAQLALSRLDLQDLDRAIDAARVRLASYWGSRMPRFRTALGRFSPPRTLLEPEILRARLRRHPEIQVRQAQIAQLKAQREIERRLRLPDIEISLGARFMAQDRDAAVVGGLQIALPVRDRGKEAIDVVDAQLRVAEREVLTQTFFLEQQLDGLLSELERRRTELVLLEETILPEVEANIRLFQEGFSMGRFTILEMLEAQRSLFELRERILNARLSFQTALIELEFLTGISLQAGGSP